MRERQKTLLWKQTQAKRDKFSAGLIKKWEAALMDQIKPVLKEISPGSVDSIAERVPQLIPEQPIADMLDITIAVVGVYFARDTFNEMTKALGPSRTEKMITKMGGVPTDEVWVNSIKHTLGKAAGRRVTSITDTSKEEAVKIIQRTLQEAAGDGLGASQMAILLRDRLGWQWGTDATYRASRIARTETTMASNLGSLQGAQQTKEPMLKVWLTTRDGRTRSRGRGDRYEHYGKYPGGPDGEKQELEDKFTKTGELLNYPGDYAGSAGNVIHCRCTMFYEPKIDDEQGEVIEPELDPIKPPVVPKPPKPRTPRKPKPESKITRAEKIKEAKAKLLALEEDSVAAKKIKKLEALMDPIKQEYDAYNIQIREFMSQLPKASEAEYLELRTKITTWQTRLQTLGNDLIHISDEIAKLKKVGYSDDIVKILSLDDGSNINVAKHTEKVRGQRGWVYPTGKARNVEASKFQAIVGNIDEAKHNVNLRVLSSNANKRAFSRENIAVVFREDGVDVVCHELGHALEEGSTFVKKKSRDFLEMRCGGEPLKDLYAGTKWKGREWVWEDKFMRSYSGRYYSRGAYPGKPFTREAIDQTYGTEAFSMWWSELMENPVRFIKEDPEYFEFFYDMILEMQGLK